MASSKVSPYMKTNVAHAHAHGTNHRSSSVNTPRSKKGQMSLNTSGNPSTDQMYAHSNSHLHAQHSGSPNNSPIASLDRTDYSTWAHSNGHTSTHHINSQMMSMGSQHYVHSFPLYQSSSLQSNTQMFNTWEPSPQQPAPQVQYHDYHDGTEPSPLLSSQQVAYENYHGMAAAPDSQHTPQTQYQDYNYMPPPPQPQPHYQDYYNTPPPQQSQPHYQEYYNTPPPASPLMYQSYQSHTGALQNYDSHGMLKHQLTENTSQQHYDACQDAPRGPQVQNHESQVLASDPQIQFDPQVQHADYQEPKEFGPETTGATSTSDPTLVDSNAPADYKDSDFAVHLLPEHKNICPESLAGYNNCTCTMQKICMDFTTKYGDECIFGNYCLNAHVRSSCEESVLGQVCKRVLEGDWLHMRMRHHWVMDDKDAEVWSRQASASLRWAHGDGRFPEV